MFVRFQTWWQRRQIALFQRLSRFCTVRSLPDRAEGLIAVALLHGLFLLFLLGGLKSEGSKVHRSELVTYLAIIPSRPSNARQPPSEPKLVDPQPQIVAPPDFVPSDAMIPNGIASPRAPQVLAPRPDPAHINSPPTYQQAALAGLGKSKVILRILVAPNGDVRDAQIVETSGLPDIDAKVRAFVCANWKFLPATRDDVPVEYWTTVFVPLAA